MIVNAANIQNLFTGFSAAFTKGLETAIKHFEEVATKAPSQTTENVYAWLGQFPKMREWIGDRVVRNLAAHGFSLKNRMFESTISIPRVSIEDDTFGLFAPIITEMGMAAGDHPNELVLSLLGAGFATLSYDGKNFFDEEHPVGDQEGAPALASNMQAGAGPAWFLLDTSRPVKPLIYQERIPYKFQQRTRDEDENVFSKDEYLYGVRARSNAGFGLWQLAFGSKAALTAANYQAARKAMMELKGDQGRPLNVKPTVLVAPPALEGDAMRLLNNGQRIEISGATPVAVTNEWRATAKPIITAWL